MAAGLPSAGIGGLFYLISAIVLPVRSAWRRVRGVPDTLTGRDLLLHSGMALGIVGGIWVAGWLLTLAVSGNALGRGAGGVGGSIPFVAPSVIRVAAIVAGFLTLAVVLTAVEVARLTLHRSAPRVPLAEPPASSGP